MKDEGEKPNTIVGHIELQNVSLTYPARQEAPVRSNQIDDAIRFQSTIPRS